jgi:hypothetical protein
MVLAQTFTYGFSIYVPIFNIVELSLHGVKLIVSSAGKNSSKHQANSTNPAFNFPIMGELTFPRFHRHLYKEECDEIGGQHDHQGQTAVHGRI